MVHFKILWCTKNTFLWHFNLRLNTKCVFCDILISRFFELDHETAKFSCCKIFMQYKVTIPWLSKIHWDNEKYNPPLWWIVFSIISVAVLETRSKIVPSYGNAKICKQKRARPFSFSDMLANAHFDVMGNFVCFIVYSLHIRSRSVFGKRF